MVDADVEQCLHVCSLMWIEIEALVTPESMPTITEIPSLGTNNS